jgi:hypothetical protein
MQATPVVAMAMDARCPLCGDSILSIGRTGHVVSAEVHPIPLLRSGLSGEGFLVCDSCAYLAHLPADITLN